MKRFLSLVCLILLALLLPAAAMISRGLPADTRPYVEKKYAGWSGVLRAWVCSGWECGGGFIRWLNACATDFEKRHDGVYIEFTPVSAETMRGLSASGVRPPELVFFSPDVSVDESRLLAQTFPDALRDELHADARALPVALGGYIWAQNSALSTGLPAVTAEISLLPDDNARCFSAALIALAPAESNADDGERALPDAGVDLGLPASGTVEAIQTADALERFISGDLPATIVTQKEIARLIRLRDAGRGADWKLAPAGRYAYTDQILFAGVVSASDENADARLTLAKEFSALLLSEAAQARLADVGAFSVTGTPVHSDFSAYAPLDALLNSRQLIVPAPFSEHFLPDCGGIVRMLRQNQLTPDAAAELLKRALDSQ